MPSTGIESGRVYSEKGDKSYDRISHHGTVNEASGQKVFLKTADEHGWGKIILWQTITLWSASVSRGQKIG